MTGLWLARHKAAGNAALPLHVLIDRDHLPSQINILPAQAEQLAQPHTRRQGEDMHRFEPLALTGV